MGCGCFCRLVVLLLTALALLFGCLCVPQVERAYIKFVDTYTYGVPLAHLALVVLGQVPRIWQVGGPLGVGPVWNPWLVDATDAYSKGDGLMLFPNPDNIASSYMLARVTHEKVREVHHNPTAKRDISKFISVETATSPPGYFADGVLPTLLQLNTDDPKRYAHRDLLSATMPSIAQSPDHVPGFQAPPGVSAQDLVRDISLHLWLPLKMVTNLVQDVFAFNFFRHAFEVDLSHEELQMLKEWLSVHSRIIVGLSSISGGKRCAELAKVLEDKVAAGAFGQRLMKEAERRGMVGADRLRKVIFEFSFAGFGGDGPGGGLATMKLLRLLQSKPEYVPMFKKDPEAFILEVIRTRGGGGAGMNPWIVESTQTHTLSTGRVVTETAGSHGATIALHANHDPAVFGGPKRDLDYALAFMPGRENADRFLSFVAEYGEIKKCPNVTGCAEAPRFCMGTFVLQRIMKQIGFFYIEGLESQGRQEM
mmetsp:Transcript_41950/g.99942  ORF Transcript_41950/g.99942 Transcript_41950/m.99942 type:complete len:479 (+) Transcript_41950:52-1488(+)